MYDWSGKKVLVTGGNGFLGHHVVKVLKERGAKEIVSSRSRDYDLRDPVAVERLFNDVKPQVVFSLAAKVGGILDNKLRPADFYLENILMGAYTYDACRRHGVEKLVNAGAGCGYPLGLPEPLKEEDFWNGFPQPESAPYSLAKKMLIIQGIAYRKQYDLSSVTFIPSNIYGEFDNFDLEKSHVIPALVRKFYEAVREDRPAVEVWGDGSAKRDFVHAYDVAMAMVLGAESYDEDLPVNIPFGRQHSIREVVEKLRDVSGFKGDIAWQTDKPSGQKSREMSTQNLNKHFPDFRPKYDLDSGLRVTYDWFAENYNGSEIRL